MLVKHLQAHCLLGSIVTKNHIMANAPKSSPKSKFANTLESFGLSNFKAFGPTEQQVPLRPITLVFGPNSSGKSSIIHFLLWMKDVLAGRGLDIYHPSAGGDSVDLGGFKQIRHGTKPETEICTRLQLTIQDERQQEHKLESISVFASCQPPADHSRRLKSLVAQKWNEILTRNPFEKLATRIHVLETSIVEASLKTLLAKEYGESRLELDLMENEDTEDDLGEFGMRRSELLAKHCPKSLAAAQIDWEEALSLTLRESPPITLTPSEMLGELQSLAAAILSNLNYTPPAVSEGSPALIRFELREAEVPILKAKLNDAQRLLIEEVNARWLISNFANASRSIDEQGLESSLSAISGRILCDDSTSVVPSQLRMNDADSAQHSQDKAGTIDTLILQMLEGTTEVPGLLTTCREAAKQQFHRFSYLGPLRTYPEREITVADLPTTIDPEGLFAWRKLFENKAVRDSVNEWIGEHSNYEILCDHRVSLNSMAQRLNDELRQRIDNWAKDVTSSRKLEDQHDRDKSGAHLFAADDWDYSTMIRESLEMISTKVTSQSTGTISLQDKRSGKQVTSRDIGVGISQLIPVLVQAKSAHGELIAIEQPELHIHPALQAELGDVFIESAMTRGNKFLIETHSEHLILRLLRRIRETTRNKLREGATPLRPEDLAILYVQSSDAGSLVK